MIFTHSAGFRAASAIDLVPSMLRLSAVAHVKDVILDGIDRSAALGVNPVAHGPCPCTGSGHRTGRDRREIRCRT
jgi:hypothetical protein